MLPSVNLNICKIHGVETKHQPAVTPVLLLSLRSFPENLAAQQWSYFQPHLHITQAVNMLHSLVYGQDDQASKSLVPSLQTVWNCQCKLIIYSLSKWKLHCLLQLQDFPNRFERVVSIRNPMGKWGMFFRRVFLGEILLFFSGGKAMEQNWGKQGYRLGLSGSPILSSLWIILDCRKINKHWLTDQGSGLI